MTTTAVKLSTAVFVTQMILSDLHVFYYSDFERENRILQSPKVF
jgi:hypothetical protein